VGDLMASRWAFEAAMVSQFKDNRYEREFYPQDKIIAEADYRKLYYIPTLESKLDYLNLNYQNKSIDPVEISSRLTLVQQEIERELGKVGRQHFLEVALLQPATFDTAVFRQTKRFLLILKQYYSNRAKAADKEKETKKAALVASLGDEKRFEAFQDDYQNEAIGVMVRNQDEPSRIIESNGQLIQKIYPVFKDPDPDHFIDFNAQFYLPSKHFMKATIDTLYFNLSVIWFMSITLYITLYYNLLRKLIQGLENISIKR
jgi:hypothetical protein